MTIHTGRSYGRNLRFSQRSRDYSTLLYAHLAMGICLLLWFLPWTHEWCEQVDADISIRLNQILAHPSPMQTFWGLLNHPCEAWLNLVVMVAVNLLGLWLIQGKPQRFRALMLIIYYWFFFQIGLLLVHLIFSDWLSIHRISPSFELVPFVHISKILSLPLKDFSSNCFPAGHTFVAIYWASFTCLYAPMSVKILSWSLVPLLILPRLLSGAHWPSDIVFTIALSFVLFSWARVILDQVISENFIVNTADY